VAIWLIQCGELIRSPAMSLVVEGWVAKSRLRVLLEHFSHIEDPRDYAAGRNRCRVGEDVRLCPVDCQKMVPSRLKQGGACL
ncbi:MAG: hypothetical protein AAAC47_24830, partial [Pararhizobium sp.]